LNRQERAPAGPVCRWRVPTRIQLLPAMLKTQAPPIYSHCAWPYPGRSSPDLTHTALFLSVAKRSASQRIRVKQRRLRLAPALKPRGKPALRHSPARAVMGASRLPQYQRPGAGVSASKVKCSTVGAAAKYGPTMARQSWNAADSRKSTVWFSSVSQ
jgi:hypothetical protein